MLSSQRTDWEENWLLVETTEPRSGGQGIVRKVRHRYTDAVGALKELKIQGHTRSERRERMAREVLALERLKGDGVPRILDHNIHRVDDDSIMLFYVAEWIEGNRLDQRVGGNPQPIDLALDWTLELARILRDCHTAKVIHRDVKPSNIILRHENSSLVLVDFGICWLEPERALTHSFSTEVGSELGNRFLRLPEMAPGSQFRRDPRTDICFAVGVLLYLLTGHAPRQLIDASGRYPHQVLSSLIPHSTWSDPRWDLIHNIFHVGFQVSINHRFQTAQEFLDALAKAKQYYTYTLPIASDSSFSQIRDLLASKVAQERQEIEQGIFDAHKALRALLSEKAKEQGMNTGQGGTYRPGPRAELNVYLTVQDRDYESINLRHVIELDDNTSYVKAFYRFQQREHTYYQGLSADLRSLQEAVLAEADNILQLLAEDLAQQLDAAFRG